MSVRSIIPVIALLCCQLASAREYPECFTRAMRPIGGPVPAESFFPNDVDDLFKVPTDVKSLDISLLGDELSGLRRFPCLRRIVVRHGDLSDKGLTHIVECRSIQQLVLQNCNNLTPEALVTLASLPSLQELNLADAGTYSNNGSSCIEPALFVALAKTNVLQRLSLQNSTVVKGVKTEDVIDSIANIRSLQTLDVSGLRGLKPEHLAVLSRLGSLTELAVQHMSYAFLSSIVGCTALSALVCDSGLSDAETGDFSPLLQLRSLKVLVLGGLGPSQALVDLLVKLSHLRFLWIGQRIQAQAKTEDYAALSRLKQLQTLVFDRDPGLTGAHLKAFIGQMNLLVLSLRHCKSLLAEDVSAVAECASLCSLELMGVFKEATDTRSLGLAAAFKSLAHSKSLVELTLSSIDGLNEMDFARIGSIRSLRVLSFNNIAGLVPAAGKGLAQLTRLEHLSLNGCSNITDSFMEVVAAFTELATLDITGTKIGDVGLKTVLGKLKLRSVDCSNTLVSKAAFENLGHSDGSLTKVIVTGTRVSMKDVLELQDCHSSTRWYR